MTFLPDGSCCMSVEWDGWNGTLTGTVTSIDSDVTASSSGSYYKMTITPDSTYVISNSGDKVDLSNGMSVTARVEYDKLTYFEYAMEALGVLFR